MNRQIIKPQYDQPIVVKLDFGADGIQRDGKYGVEYQYTLNDNSAVMWLPQQGRDALLRTQAQAGDYVQLAKQRRGQGSYWTAQVMPDAAEDLPQPTVTRQPPQQQKAVLGRAASNAIAPPAQAIPQSHPMEDLMVRCLVVGARANLRAYEELRRQGIETEAPIWEDFRATGTSLFIERNKQENSR